MIVALTERGTQDTVHVTNAVSGLCTWYGFAKKAVELCKPDVTIEPVSSNAYPSRAPRPANSALDATRGANLVGHPLPPWKDALERYLAEKGYLE